jgi:carboxymethylenebutenolidase
VNSAAPAGKRQTASWRLLLAAVALLGTTGCAATLHASAVAPAPIHDGVAHLQSGSHRIRIDYFEPLEKGGRRPAVIVVHGSSGVHQMIPNTATRYARALAEQGLDTFVVHYFDSTHSIIAGLTAENRHYFTWAKVLADAVSWVRARPEVDPDRVGLLGHSLGAFLAVGVASTDSLINRVVLLGGGLEPFLKEKVTRMPPTLIFHGEADTEVPLSEAENLVAYLRERGCDVELRVFPNEKHIFSTGAINEALTEAARFFRPELPQPDGPAAEP